MPVTSDRDIFVRDTSKTAVTIFTKMPVTLKKWPLLFSKIECHAHKKMSRKKKTELHIQGTVTPVRVSENKKVRKARVTTY